jgi:hypothetical protein
MAKVPNVLRRLNQIRSNLLEGLGIEVTISRITTGGNRSKANTSYVKIRKIPPAPPIPPVSENHEGDQAKNAGGISSNGGTIPPRDKIPPAQNTENHVQNQRLVIHCHSYF